MLSDDQTNDLLECPWLPKVYDGTVYLAKFHAYPTKGTCVFMITDTKSLWSEVVKNERLAWRYRALNSGPKERNVDDASEKAFRSDCLGWLSRLHQLRNFIDADFAVEKGVHTDLKISLGHGSRKWDWEVDSLGHLQSSSILSAHLVMPLFTLANVAFNSSIGTPVSSQTPIDLQKELDKVAKVTRRNPSLGVSQALKRPRLNSALQRVTAVVGDLDTDKWPPIIEEFEDYETMESVPDSLAQEDTVQRELATSSKLTEPAQSTQSSSTPLFSSHRSSPPRSQKKPASPPYKSYSGEETLHTGPSNEGEEGGGNKLSDESVTESEGDSESPPPTKKRRIVDSPSTSATPHKSRVVESGESSTDGPEVKISKGTRRGVVNARVKQPIKRGGRRL